MDACFGATETEDLQRLMAWALREDGEDVTTNALFAADVAIEGRIVARRPCRVAGLPAAVQIARTAGLALEPLVPEGADVAPDAAVASVGGTVRGLLGIERPLLNMLGRLSGIATTTADYAAAFRPTPVYDTRKTTPGWRTLEKYAVRVGGGRNHRAGLYDQFLVKDNHLAALARTGGTRTLAAIVARARAHRPELAVEVEVETFEAFEAAVLAGADFVMLDNWPTPSIARAVAWLDARGPRRAALELSGGITLARAPELARIGADRVSVGALTHSAPSCDFSLDL